jgi:hypothetical protein
MLHFASSLGGYLLTSIYRNPHIDRTPGKLEMEHIKPILEFRPLWALLGLSNVVNGCECGNNNTKSYKQ